MVIALLVFRVALHGMADEQRARWLHDQAFCLVYAVLPAVIAGGGLDQPFKLASGEPMDLHLLVPMLAPLSLYSRHAAVPEAHRLGLEVLVVVCAFLGPPLTTVGQPTEALVVLTVLLLSELLGYSLELQRRLAHADGLQTRRKLQDAEAHASQLELEAVRLRAELTSMTSVLSDECGAALTPHQLKNLVGSEEVQQGLNLSEFFLEKRAGMGSFATVWRARYDGRRVALKQPHAKCSESDLVRFVREVQTLRSLDHPHIVRFVGAVWEPSLVLVLEWMAGGSVHQYLAAAAEVGGAAPTLSAPAMALDVAKGMGLPPLSPSP